MTEYVLDFKTNSHIVLDKGPLPLVYSCNRSYVEYYFKIDSNGNVNISKFEKTEDGRPNRQGGGIEQVLSINDNIPIPNYLIGIINFLLKPITSGDIEWCKQAKKDVCHVETQMLFKTKNMQLTQRYWEIVADTIKRIKQEVKDIIENPQDNLDIKTQLDTYISKTSQQQENLLELEKKIENIQTAYFDALNDNKKLKEIIKTKDIKHFELESEINRLKGEINTIKQLTENNIKEQQKMEELEKERLWSEYKRQKQNYNPFYH